MEVAGAPRQRRARAKDRYPLGGGSCLTVMRPIIGRSVIDRGCLKAAIHSGDERMATIGDFPARQLSTRAGRSDQAPRMSSSDITCQKPGNDPIPGQRILAREQDLLHSSLGNHQTTSKLALSPPGRKGVGNLKPATVAACTVMDAHTGTLALMTLGVLAGG